MLVSGLSGRPISSGRLFAPAAAGCFLGVAADQEHLRLQVGVRSGPDLLLLKRRPRSYQSDGEMMR